MNFSEEKLMKLSADPETRREYELRAKALSDERSRMEDAKEEGIFNVVKSLLERGMPLSEIAKHTPYTLDELSKLVKNEEKS
ncbi:hypothetical protein RCG23_14705 [Neobacillus sp. PS3-34]|uniref:hypothetical protein n=1 Tax=Neobacillus sp. PS3-34 TaxID=3070678 RepID=UPI0027E175D4|nr:hypothetical protein [Neobacillus sp. PS3-34]WML46882.1 hypothetical protein RCG23_14705 [Neobacillus sp. PS3-34]